MSDAIAPATIGHNSGEVAGALCIAVTVRLFNSVIPAGSGPRERSVALPAGSSLADLAAALGIPRERVYVAFRNGRDLSPGWPVRVAWDREIIDGDVIALSGPVPFSWGYGAPVV